MYNKDDFMVNYLNFTLNLKIQTDIIYVCNYLAFLIFPPSTYNTLTRKKEMFYLTTYSTHFIYGYMASDIW